MRRGKAIVIGAGMAGLFSARVLCDHFEEVLIIERDDTFSSISARAGAAQGDHLHVLLKRGQEILAALFPGIDEELASAGAPLLDWGLDTAWLNPFGWTPRFPTPIVTRSCSRPLLEAVTRKRVAELPNVRVLTGRGVTALLGDASRVTGVEVGDGRLAADLVVDATGRNGALISWLAGLGLNEDPPPLISSTRVGYASRRYHLPRARDLEWRQLYIQLRPPDSRRGGVICPIENDTYLVTLLGVGDEAPAACDDEFLAFAKGLSDLSLFRAIANGEPLSPVRTYRKTGNRFHLLHQRKRWPRGFVALGDAVCSLNPVYGQGMTLAALSASLLPKYLDREAEFQRALARQVAFPWRMATGEDARLLSAKPGLVPLLFSHILRKATESARVHRSFLEVLHMVKSPYTLLLRL